MGSGQIDRLTQLHRERARHMDAVQAIDDEAAAIVAQKIAATQAVLEQWPHVVPAPPPVMREFKATDPLPPGVPVNSVLEAALPNGSRRYRDPGGTGWVVTDNGAVHRLVKDHPQA